jgi:predicted dinucleotide-binding enzyme
MTIGILGTGRMALRLATLFADQGHAVTLGSRAPARARALAHADRLGAGAAMTHGALARKLFDQAGGNQR